MTESCLQQDNEDCDEEAHGGGGDDDESTFWERTLIRRNGWVDHLNQRAFLGLVELCQLELTGKDIKDWLVVLDVAKPSDVFHGRRSHPAFQCNDVTGA